MSIETRKGARGVKYVARIKSNGDLVATKTFAKKADAEGWEREQYRALAYGQFIAPANTSTPFGQVADAFLEARAAQVPAHTWRTDRDNISALPEKWRSLPIGSIGEKELLDYFTEALQVKARSTVQRARTTLSSLFAYAVRERKINTNPVRGVKMPPGQEQESEGVETFTDAEFAATLAAQRAINPRMADVTEFIALTGLRWGELRALRVSNLQEVPIKGIRVRRAQSDGYDEKATKNRARRTVPLTGRAWELAAPRAEGRDGNEYLFASATGKQLRGNLFRRFVKWGATAPDRTIHDLRHYAASSWLRAGIPVHQVSAWLGHRNPATTLRVYAHVLGESQDAAAVALLNRLNALEPPSDATRRTGSDRRGPDVDGSPSLHQ